MQHNRTSATQRLGPRNERTPYALAIIAAIALIGTLVPSEVGAVNASPLRAAGSFTDPVGDGTDPYNPDTGDIASAKVTHTSRVVTATYTLAANGGFPNGVYWQFDTKAGDPGPEFLVSWTYDAPDAAYVVRVKNWVSGWAGQIGQSVPCKGAHMTALDRGQKMTIPRSCLVVKGTKPGKVRAHLETSDLSSSAATDYAPDARSYGAWVRVG